MTCRYSFKKYIKIYVMLNHDFHFFCFQTCYYKLYFFKSIKPKCVNRKETDQDFSTIKINVINVHKQLKLHLHVVWN